MRNKQNYNRSNKIQAVDFYISNQAKDVLQKLLQSQETEDRQSLGENLLTELSALSEISVPTLKISNVQQYHKKHKGKTVFKQYGYYKPAQKYIYIHNKTAVRGQILAPKTFTDTLLHEWLHHYDTEALQLDSVHTAGFYARLKDLKNKLGWR